MPRFLDRHLLQYPAAARIGLRKSAQMIFEVRLDLRFGFADEAKAASIASQARKCADTVTAGEPDRRQPTRRSAELGDAPGAPGKVVVFFLGGFDQVSESFGRPCEQGLAVVQRLRGDLAGMIHTHQSNAAPAIGVVEFAVPGGFGELWQHSAGTRFGETGAQRFGSACKRCVEPGFAMAHAWQYNGCSDRPRRLSLRALITGSASVVTKKRLAILAMLVASAGVFAQDEESDENDPFEGAASFGYLSTSGNSDSQNVNAAFSLKWQPSAWSHEFKVSAVRAETSGITTADAQFANYSARREFGEKSFLFATLDWQSDEFSAYDSQLSETVGYGRHLVETNRHTLNIEVGGGARQADLRTGEAQDESIVRGAIDYAWDFSETAGFQQSFVIESGSSNTRSESLSELRADILGNLKLVLSYRLRHNSDVPAGIEKSDRFTAISLEYGF